MDSNRQGADARNGARRGIEPPTFGPQPTDLTARLRQLTRWATGLQNAPGRKPGGGWATRPGGRVDFPPSARSPASTPRREIWTEAPSRGGRFGKTFTTNDSPVVPHLSTELAQRCLVSQIGRDATRSPRYERMMGSVRLDPPGPGGTSGSHQKSSSSGNRTPGVCVTGRNVTNYTNEDCSLGVNAGIRPALDHYRLSRCIKRSYRDLNPDRWIQSPEC